MKYKSALLFLFLMMIPWSHEAYCIQIVPCKNISFSSSDTRQKVVSNGLAAVPILGLVGSVVKYFINIIRRKKTLPNSIHASQYTCDTHYNTAHNDVLPHEDIRFEPETKCVSHATVQTSKHVTQPKPLVSKSLEKSLEITVLQDAITFFQDEAYAEPAFVSFQGTQEQQEFHAQNMTMLHWHMNSMQDGPLEQKIIHAFGIQAQTVAHFYNKKHRVSELPEAFEKLTYMQEGRRLTVHFVHTVVTRFVDNNIYSTKFLTQKIQSLYELSVGFARISLSIMTQSPEQQVKTIETFLHKLSGMYTAAAQLTAEEWVTLAAHNIADIMTLAVQIQGIAKTAHVVKSISIQFPGFMSHVMSAIANPCAYITAFCQSIKSMRDVIKQTPEYVIHAIKTIKDVISGPPQPIVLTTGGSLAGQVLPEMSVLEDVLAKGAIATGVIALSDATNKTAHLLKQQWDKERALRGLRNPKTESYTPTYKFGKYEDAPYHTNRGNAVKSKKPINGQKALDNSFPYSEKNRIGVSEGEIVVLTQTSENLYHGHVRIYEQLTSTMKNILNKGGLVNLRGKILIK